MRWLVVSSESGVGSCIQWLAVSMEVQESPLVESSYLGTSIWSGEVGGP
jgi:hypothetical protein